MPEVDVLSFSSCLEINYTRKHRCCVSNSIFISAESSKDVAAYLYLYQDIIHLLNLHNPPKYLIRDQEGCQLKSRRVCSCQLFGTLFLDKRFLPFSPISEWISTSTGATGTFYFNLRGFLVYITLRRMFGVHHKFLRSLKFCLAFSVHFRENELTRLTFHKWHHKILL